MAVLGQGLLSTGIISCFKLTIRSLVSLTFPIFPLKTLKLSLHPWETPKVFHVEDLKLFEHALNSSHTQLETLNAHQLNNTKNAQRDLLFFNRVPKVGSEQLIELIRRLGKANSYHVSRAPFSEPVLARLDEEAQEELLNEIDAFEPPHAFAMHVNYIDFRKFDMTQPIYINMVRDPVERVISWFYYRRTPWTAVQMYNLNRKFQSTAWYKKDFDACVLSYDTECNYAQGLGFKNQNVDHKRQTLFFCGHEPECEPFNTQPALQLAMRNVERDYAVVGSWEDINVTLTVLEHYIPKYFHGASKLYYDPDGGLAKKPQNINPWKPRIDKDVKLLVRRNFTKEYEFYNFCKQRLYKQYFAIKNNQA